MTLPNALQRQTMQRLSTDRWRRVATLDVAAGDKLLAGLIRNGWIELRENEIRLTPAGLEALKAKIPGKSSNPPKQDKLDLAGRRPLPRPQVRPIDK